MNQNSMAGIEKVRALGVTDKQCQAILLALLKKSPLTRDELSSATGIIPRSICGRVGKLKKMQLIYSPCSKLGRYKRPNQALSLTEKACRVLVESQVTS